MRKPFCMELAGGWLGKILIHLGGADLHISLTVGREQRIGAFVRWTQSWRTCVFRLQRLFFFLFNSKLAFYVLVSARVFIVML